MNSKKDLKISSLIFINLIMLSITLLNIIGTFGMSRFVFATSTEVTVGFDKALVKSISYTPQTAKTKEVEVTITPPDNLQGTIQYKIGESGTWTDYIGNFNCDKQNLYTRVKYTDRI